MSSQYHFIAGLPRSGSTLLSAVLRQNPRFYADMMSPVHGMISGLINSWSAGKEIAPLVNAEQKRAIVQGVFQQFHNQNKAVVFDSNRGWAEKLPLIDDLYPDAKVICCVRNMAWVLDSFEKLYLQDPYEQTRLFPSDNDRSTVYTRTRSLANQNRVVGFSMQALRQAFFSEHSNKLILVDYEALVQKPSETIGAIYKALGEKPFQHDFNNVGFESPEFDANLGVPGLHSVRSSIVHKPRASILPPDLFQEYANNNFWHDRSLSKASYIGFEPKSVKQSTAK